MFLVSGSLFRVSGFPMNRDSAIATAGFEFLVPGSGFRVPCFELMLVLCILITPDT